MIGEQAARGISKVATASGMRAGSLAFYLMTGIPTAIAYKVTGRRETAVKVAIAAGAYVMLTSNYIHPFGRGPNPLKFGFR